MTRQRRRPVAIAVIIFMSFAIGVLAYHLVFDLNQRTTIKIAVVIPKTGENAEAGKELSDGQKLIEQYWKKNSDLNPVLGYNITTEIYDDSSTTGGAVHAARQIIADPTVFMVVGHFRSDATLEALSYYKNAGLPVVMPFATATEITRGNNFPNAFRMPPTNENQAQTLVKFIFEEVGAKSLHIIKDGSFYSKSLHQSVEESLKSRRIDPPPATTIKENNTDFSELVSNLSTASIPVDAVLFIGYAKKAALFAGQFYRYIDNACLVTSDGVYGEEFKSSNNAEKTIVIYQVAPEDSLLKRDQWRLFEQFHRDYKKKIDGEPGGWAAWTWDALNLSHEAIRQMLVSGSVPNAQKLTEVLNGKSKGNGQSEDETLGFRYEGALGSYYFDETNDNREAKFYFYEIKEGNYEPLTDSLECVKEYE